MAPLFRVTVTPASGSIPAAFTVGTVTIFEGLPAGTVTVLPPPFFAAITNSRLLPASSEIA